MGSSYSSAFFWWAQTGQTSRTCPRTNPLQRTSGLSDQSDQSEPTKKRTSDQSDWSEVEEVEEAIS